MRAAAVAAAAAAEAGAPDLPAPPAALLPGELLGRCLAQLDCRSLAACGRVSAAWRAAAAEPGAWAAAYAREFGEPPANAADPRAVLEAQAKAPLHRLSQASVRTRLWWLGQQVSAWRLIAREAGAGAGSQLAAGEALAAAAGPSAVVHDFAIWLRFELPPGSLPSGQAFEIDLQAELRPSSLSLSGGGPQWVRVLDRLAYLPPADESALLYASHITGLYQWQDEEKDGGGSLHLAVYLPAGRLAAAGFALPQALPWPVRPAPGPGAPAPPPRSVLLLLTFHAPSGQGDPGGHAPSGCMGRCQVVLSLTEQGAGGWTRWESRRPIWLDGVAKQAVLPTLPAAPDEAAEAQANAAQDDGVEGGEADPMADLLLLDDRGRCLLSRAGLEVWHVAGARAVHFSTARPTASPELMAETFWRSQVFFESWRQPDDAAAEAAAAAAADADREAAAQAELEAAAMAAGGHAGPGPGAGAADAPAWWDECCWPEREAAMIRPAHVGVSLTAKWPLRDG